MRNGSGRVMSRRGWYFIVLSSFSWTFCFLFTGRHLPQDRRKISRPATSAPPQSRTYQVGDEVLTYYSEDCMWYPGRLQSISQNGTYLVKWDEPEDGIEEVWVAAKDMRIALIPVHKLKIGERYSGVVFDISSRGAFVDIGAEEHGLLPLARMSKTWIDSPLDVIQEGQQVNVWISSKNDGHFSVTMVKELLESDPRPFLHLSAEQWVEGVVTRIAAFNAAFVKVSLDGASLNGLLHISELSDSYVSHVRDVLSEGQKVKVRVLSVDADSGKMILSMKGGNLKNPTGPTPQLQALETLASLPSDQWLRGKVVRVMNFGAFVAVKPEEGGAAVEGLLHKSEISDDAACPQWTTLSKCILFCHTLVAHSSVSDPILVN